MPSNAPDRVLQGAHAALRELLRVAVRVGHQRVELGTEDVAVAERRVDQVPRQRQERDRLADRIERGDHHRVGQVRRVRSRRLSMPTSRTLIRSPSLGTGPSRGTRVRGRPRTAPEDLGERVAEGRAVAIDDQVRDATTSDDDQQAADARAGRSARCGRCRGTPGRRPASRQTRSDDVERQERAEDLRGHDPGGQPRRRLDWTTSSADAQHDQGWDRKSTASAGRRLNSWPSPGITADSVGRGEAAEVGWPVSGRIRVACTRGSGSSVVGRSTRVSSRSLPGRAGHGDAGRSISLP